MLDTISEWWKLQPRIHEAWFGRRLEQFRFARGSFEQWALIAAEEGRFRYAMQGERGTAQFGDVVICPPHVELNRHVVQHLTHHVLWFSWQDESGREVHPTSPALCGKRTARDLTRLSSDYALLQTLEGRYDAYSLRLKGHALFDIIWLCCGEDAQSAKNPTGEAQAEVADELMGRAARYLHTHLSQPLSLQNLAASLDLSPVQFTRRFRRATGSTPNEYLTSLRLQKARELLVETDLTIHEVAHQCGYQSGLYLSRLFEQELHIRPGKYRRQHRF